MGTASDTESFFTDPNQVQYQVPAVPTVSTFVVIETQLATSTSSLWLRLISLEETVRQEVEEKIDEERKIIHGTILLQGVEDGRKRMRSPKQAMMYDAFFASSAS